MQAYGQKTHFLLIEKRKTLDRLFTEGVRRKHHLPHFFQFSLITRVNGEQRIALLHLVSNFAMDDKSHRMIDRIRLASAPCPEHHRSLPHAPRLDLSQVAVSRR